MDDTLSFRFLKRFPGATVIRGELAIPPGVAPVTVLFGPSGCGKTTVLRCLAGLERPEEGSVRFGRETWFDAESGVCLGPQQRDVGFVFQNYALFPHLTVEQNIGYGLHSMPTPERQQRTRHMLDVFGLAALAHRHPRQLSGGQQQRVAVARSLARRPRLLLLDEPLAALDATLREELRGELRQVLADCGVPVFLVTHDRTEALTLGDRLVVMHQGAMRQSGPALDVFNRPADAEVARIVGMETLQPGHIEGVDDGLATVTVGAARLIAVAPPNLPREVIVCIRGEDVILERDRQLPPASARNRLVARVLSSRLEGPLLRVELDAGFPLRALITRQAGEDLGLQPGQEMVALIKAPSVHLLPR